MIMSVTEGLLVIDLFKNIMKNQVVAIAYGLIFVIAVVQIAGTDVLM